MSPGSNKFRGGATRCSLKQSVGMVALRMIAPLAMRNENRERREYLKEKKRYKKYLREQQQQQQQQQGQEEADATTTDTHTTPSRGPSSRLKRFTRHLSKAASKLKPTRTPAPPSPPPPRRMPHWDSKRPKPLPTWLKRDTQASSAYPAGYRPGPRRDQRVSGSVRGDGESGGSVSPSGPSSSSSSSSRAGGTSSEARGAVLLGERRREVDAGPALGTRVVNREDMPARYRHMTPY